MVWSEVWGNVEVVVQVGAGRDVEVMVRVGAGGDDEVVVRVVLWVEVRLWVVALIRRRRLVMAFADEGW